MEFVDISSLRDGELTLVLQRAAPADPVKDWLPAYHFHICLPDGTRIGRCDLRIGHNRKSYFGGNIGFTVFSDYRGHHYAEKACRLLFELAKKHEMDYLIITCRPDNIASRRTCERLGGELLEIAELPEDNDMRSSMGLSHVLVFHFKL